VFDSELIALTEIDLRGSNRFVLFFGRIGHRNFRADFKFCVLQQVQVISCTFDARLALALKENNCDQNAAALGWRRLGWRQAIRHALACC